MLIWRCAIFKEIRCRITREIKRYPDFVIYSDAATTMSRIPAILFKGGQRGSPEIELLTKDRTPFSDSAIPPRKPNICLEILAPMGFICANRCGVGGNSSISAYLGSNNALCALTRGELKIKYSGPPGPHRALFHTK